MCARTRARERRPAPDWPVPRCPSGGVWGGGMKGGGGGVAVPSDVALWGARASVGGGGCIGWATAEKGALALLGADVKKKKKKSNSGPARFPVPAREVRQQGGWVGPIGSVVRFRPQHGIKSGRQAKTRSSYQTRWKPHNINYIQVMMSGESNHIPSHWSTSMKYIRHGGHQYLLCS